MRALWRGALSTRVGRRTLVLFVVSALLPTFVLAGLSYAHVRATMERQAATALSESTKRRAVQVVERATWLGHLLRDQVRAGDATIDSSDTDNGPRLRRAFFVDGEGQPSAERLGGDTTSGRTPTPPTMGTRPGHPLADGSVAIVVEHGVTPRVWFVANARAGGHHGTLWAEPDPRFLWGFDSTESLSPELCIVEVATKSPLRCTAGASAAVAIATTNGTPPDDWITASRTVFLGGEFGTGDWTVISMMPSRTALQPFDGFARTLLLVSALSLMVVFFASQVQIRRQTEPLERLHHATQDVARGHFDVVVPDDSPDEFGALARSFSAMSSSLGRQVKLWRAMDDVDRQALLATDVEALVAAAANTITTAAKGARAVVAVRTASGEGWTLCDSATPGGAQATTAESTQLEQHRQTDLGHEAAGVVRTLATLGVSPAPQDRWVLFPLWHRDEHHGFVAVGFDRSMAPTPESRRELRQLVDRLAVALANARLVRRLDALSIGTITAFARAIDANSAWTAGHSERVTQLALRLGEALELSEPERERLQRGALLHDIGKLGVPASIVNKPGRLSDQERTIMQAHPTLGVTILQPIGAFADILPIIRSHHERLDGMGYPDGLSGSTIPYLARVLSVADVYDALVSDRPYRAGMEPAVAAAVIRADVGSSFDPHIAQVFLALHDRGEIEALRAVDAPATALADAVGHTRLILQESA